MGHRAGHDIDIYRSVVFPNAIRDLRKSRGFSKLLSLATKLPDIPYVRLSKIERGEVFAKAHELRRIASALHVEPQQLLIDVDRKGFDISEWAEDLHDWSAADLDEDYFAVALAAAVRARRDGDKALSIAAIEHHYGIAPVILSRLENAHKPLGRWNAQTVRAVCALLGVPDVPALRAYVADAKASGALDAYFAVIANPAIRIEKTKAKVAALRAELAETPVVASIHQARTSQPGRIVSPVQFQAEEDVQLLSAIKAADTATVRLVPVFGVPLLDGLIERVPVGGTVEAPRRAGPNSYGLRVCRATLGPALPAHATVIVDPDGFPSQGGIAVVREEGGLRLLVVTFDREGKMIGFSAHPDREVVLDGIDPADIATVIAVLLD